MFDKKHYKPFLSLLNIYKRQYIEYKDSNLYNIVILGLVYTVQLLTNFDLKQTGREEITFVKLKQTINEESNCLCKNNPTLYDDSTILNGSQSVTYCATILFLFFFLLIPRKEGEKKEKVHLSIFC